MSRRKSPVAVSDSGSRNERLPSSSTEESSLGDVVALLIDARWRVISIVALALLAGTAWIFVAPVKYRADALVQMDDQRARKGAITEAASEFDIDSRMGAEMEVVKSRAVVGQVVDQLQLDIVARPNYLPLIGRPLAKRLPEGWRGVFRSRLPQFAWGGEAIVVKAFDVPFGYRDHRLTLVALSPAEFSLFDEEGNPIGAGQVGRAFEATLQGEGSVRLLVTDLRAERGTSFTLVRHSRMAAIADLQKALKVTEEGRQSGNQPGVLKISLDGEDPAKTVAIVDRIAQFYVAQHVEWRLEDVQKTLTFLEGQQPLLKEQMERAEASLRDYRHENQPVELPIEASKLLDRAVQIEAEISTLRREQERYQPIHPRHGELQSQIASLASDLSAIRARLQQFPRKQQQTVDLTREANIYEQLYTRLMNNIQELRVMKAVALSNVRIIDRGDVSAEPVSPKRALILTVALIAGLLGGIARVIIGHQWRSRVTTPSEIEEQLGLPVFAALPRTATQRRLERRGKRDVTPVLAHALPNDNAVEVLRSLRTWLRVSQSRQAGNALLITGPSQGVGKTFVSINLAAVLAATGKRVLLIEADMRKGNLDKYLGVGAHAGLSDLLVGEPNEISEVIYPVADNAFHLLPRGTLRHDASELLQSEKFSRLIELARERYDEVIVDSPPVLPVADAAIIGQCVDSALLVVHQGMNSVEEIGEAVKRLEQTGVQLKGVVFNGLAGSRWSYGYSYDYRQAVSGK